MGVSVRPGVQEEVVAFVQSLRASRSHPSAPPNALSVSNVTHAICVHFRTFMIYRMRVSWLLLWLIVCYLVYVMQR